MLAAKRVFLPLVLAVALLGPVPSARADAPWGPSQRVVIPGMAQPGISSMAVDDSSNLYLLWTEMVVGGWDLYFSRREAATGAWSPKERVNDRQGMAEPGRIAVDPAGKAYVVWMDRRDLSLGSPSGLNYDIYFSRRDATTGSWSRNERVNDDTVFAYQGHPHIAVDRAGNAYAIWVDFRPGGLIYFSRRDASTGQWGPNERVQGDREVWRCAYTQLPSIAVDGAGNAYAIWGDCTPGTTYDDIFFSRRERATGQWEPAVRVNDDSGPTSQHAPSIAVDAAGNAYAVWEDGRGGTRGGSGVYFSRRDAATGQWSPNIRVNDIAGSEEFPHPLIALDAQGNLNVAWWDHRDGFVGIYFARKEPSAAIWSPSVRVDDDPEGGGSGVQMVADRWGDLYAAYRDYRGGQTDLYLSVAQLAPRVFYFPFVVREWAGGW